MSDLTNSITAFVTTHKDTVWGFELMQYDNKDDGYRLRIFYGDERTKQFDVARNEYVEVIESLNKIFAE